MGWIQLLLLGFLSSCFTCSSGVWGYRIERSPDERFRQLCEGVEVELKNCNLRLAEKIKNTTGIEKEMFTLKRQLRQLRLTCKDASQAASVQISALQNQLDSLLKQLGESTSGPANEVMIIMKKYINMKKLEMDMTMQSDTSKISLMQDQLKALEAELKQKTAALKEVKCSADGGGEEAEISRIVEEINKLSLEGSTSAEISRLAGLKTILDKKLNKMDGTGFATSEKISVIMEGNKQMVVIQRKLADLLKTEAEYTALLQRLKVKKVLLSDLKEEKNEKGPNPELSKHITVVEKEVWALEDELELLKRTLSRREVLEKELLQKKKQVEGKLEELKKKMELFSRLLSVQLELQVTQVRWMGEKAAAEVFIKDLQKHLEEKEDKISRLLAKNIYLDKKLADLMAECDDIQVKFNELSDQLEATLGKLPNTNLKYVLEIVTLNIDIDSIRETITREKSLSKIEELKKLLKKKTDELNLKKYELKNKDPSAVKILVIIEKTKEIQNLQSSVVNVNDLDSISKLQKELIKLIDDLDDSNPAKLVLKNMVMLSEESWLKKLINKMNQRSQQQITDLEKVLKETEETLKYKTAELVKTGSYADQLIKDIVVLRGDVKKIKEELSRLQVSSVSQVAELEKMLTKTKQELEKGNRSLNDKDAELAKNMARITQLIEELRQTKLRAQENDEEAAATIADLEKRVRKSEEEKNRVKQENRKLQEDLREARKCTEVHESYSELQDKYDKEVSKLSNNFARQVLTIKTLSDEVSLLKSKLSVATGNTDALEAELKKKSGDLMKVMKELEKSKVDSSEMVKLLEAMRKLNKQQDQSIAEYLAEIDALGKEMEGLTAKLGTRGDEKAQLTIQVMVLKEEISKLEKLQSDLKQEAVKKTESLKNEIEETKKEIIFLKRSGCKTEETKQQIDRLQVEVKAKERELEKLKQNSEAEQDQLAEKLAQIAKKLESSGVELKKKDAQNAELIQQLLDLGQKLKDSQSGQNTIKEEAEKQINDLEKRVRKSEEEKNRVKQENRKLQEDLREARKCTEVHESYSELQDKYDKEVSKLSNNFARQVLTIKTLSDEVNLLKSKLSVATGNTDALEAELKKKSGDLMKVMKELEKSKVDSSEMVKLLEAMRKLDKQQDQSIAEYLAEIDALGKEMEGLTAKLGTRGDEKAQLTIQVMVLKEEISKLEKLQSDLKQEAVKKSESLKNEIEETKKEIIFLKRSGCKTEETKQQIDRLQVEVKAKERELEKLKQNSEAEQDQLAEKLAQIAKKLESSGVELKKKDAQNAELIQQLLDLGQKLKDSQSGQNTIKEEAEKQINDLEKRVRKSEEEKNRVKQENRKLQEDLREARKCTEVHESYSELQDKYDKEVSKLSNNFARQVLTIKTLSDEVSLLKSKLSVATGNTDALEAELKKKSGDLMKVMKELEKSKVDSSEMVKLLEAMRKLNKQQDQSIAEYLAEIDALGKEMEGLTAKLGTRGDEKAQLTIQVMVLKEEISKLEKLQSDLKQEAVKKTESLKNEIEETKKEIIFLKRSGCKTEETKQQIDRLQVEVKAKERELEKLKQNSEAEQDQLAEKLAQIAKKLESSGVELKKKDAQNAELIQQLLDLGQKLKDSQSGQNTIKEEAEKQINDLEKRVRKSEEEKNRVKQENRKLQEDLREARKCTEVHESYSELQDKYDKEVSKLSNNFARQVLTIKTLSDEVSLLKSKLSVATGNTDALEAELKKKSGDLMKVMKELEKSKVDSSEMVKLLEAMRKLDKQQDQSIAEYLAEIDALGKEMEGLTAKLGTRGDEKAQLTIQVMVLKEEISKLEKLQSDLKQEAVKKTESLKNEIEETKKEIIFLKRSGCKTEETKQQIDRLQVEVKAKERELEKLKQNSEAEQDQLAEKLAQIAKKLESSGVELKKKDAQNAELIQQLLDLGQKLKDSQSGQNTIKEEAEKQINDLKIKLKNKEVELSQLKISNSDLEERVRKSEEEKNRVKQENRKLQEDLKEARKCTEVHESYSELQTKFDKDVSKLTNDFARQVLTIQTLSDEVTALQNKLSKSEGNTDALQVELKKKTADLEKVTKELSKSKLGSAETVKLLEAMRKLNKQQDQSIAEYLAEIDALGKDMEGLMAKLGSRGDEKAQLTIQVMVLKEEISKLEKLQSDLKQEAVKKTESLKNEIEETKKEIIFLKRSGCKTEETKQQIDRLQLEVKAKERELEKLKKNTEAELDQLMEKLSEKTKKLEFSGKELSEKDEQNAKLIQQLIDLGQKMKETQSGQKTIKEEAEKQINDLKQQLQKKEEDVSKLKQSNTDLKEQVKNKDKDVSQLNNEKAALNAELGKKKEELIKAEKEVKVKEEAIDNVKKELKTKEEEIKGGCSEVTKKLKSKEEEVTKLKESHKNTLNENEKLKTQISDTDAKLQELEELERENEELQKELAKVQEEYKNKIEETKTNAFTVVSPEWDPDTAHPQLLLTSKGKAVKASEFARFVPDNPERFNAALAALGKKGYDSGKPYWEVDVDIRACFVVGVAKKSANRKGSLAYGPKNGYWVIVRRKDGQYHALNDKSTPLKLPVKPTVIGVLLDFNKGNVVFFNAKTKKPIYTYHNNKFSETLFPYIETCHSQGKNEPPIVVSDADSVLMDNVS